MALLASVVALLGGGLFFGWHLEADAQTAVRGALRHDALCLPDFAGGALGDRLEAEEPFVLADRQGCRALHGPGLTPVELIPGGDQHTFVGGRDLHRADQRGVHVVVVVARLDDCRSLVLESLLAAVGELADDEGAAADHGHDKSQR